MIHFEIFTGKPIQVNARNWAQVGIPAFGGERTLVGEHLLDRENCHGKQWRHANQVRKPWMAASPLTEELLPQHSSEETDKQLI